ncbi:DUF3592 domain-containing protein [Pseudodesulfovibrio sp.]|nr:DUF3592 domain-containing protein [Pseudodesulfovibrio sp.]
MVYISSTPVKRSPALKIMRYLFGAVMVTLIIYVISQLPYDILREERFRLFGETHTTGIVTEVRTGETADMGSRFLIEYRYTDGDGYPHQAVAALPKSVWERYRAGSRIEAIYATSRPRLVRVKQEIEPPFQVWLRGILH